ncbi:MAG: hypothetical protein JRD19_07875 [Deltaproteobacteria bacterium]|jgi:hypothetical protein|nr:hypothetical protein [Deltaproteobacteria bacterium]
MNCDASHECAAKSRPDTPCWDIAAELHDYRHALDICKDCIVHMLKADDSILTRQEMEAILTHKANCGMA